MKKLITTIVFSLIVIGTSITSSKADVNIDVTITNLVGGTFVNAWVELSTGFYPVDIDPTANADNTLMHIGVTGVDITDMVVIEVWWTVALPNNEYGQGSIWFKNLYGTGDNSDTNWTLTIDGYWDPNTYVNTSSGTLYRSTDTLTGTQY